ncbi:MAG: heavy metal translocating P-type ATPase [Sulfurospirillum sp.]|nr:MAG: heavy metal translocating P-type ATPase [Sulfurospirillum sp.]
MSKIACSHCHLEFDKSMLIFEKIDGKDCFFCCNGCQGVYHLLKAEGLDDFYDRAKDTKLNPAKVDLSDLDRFDMEGFKKRYVKEDDGFCSISLIIEGIHCSACVWLNERVLHKADGIIEAQINFTTHKAKIVWDDDVIKLSKIIELIRSIGYDAYPYDASLQEERANKKRKEYYIRLLVGVFATMNVMWLAIAQYAGYFTGIDDEHKKILQIAQFVLATPTLFYTGWVYFKGAYYGLKNRFINMDFLVITGALLTYIYSIYAMISGDGETYFESTIMIITFVFVGKYLEILSKKSAIDTMDHLRSSLPTEVIVIKDDAKLPILVENVKEGDIIEIKPGEKIVIDGEILQGCGNFDESSITGESGAVYKCQKDTLFSGTINLDSVIRYKALKRYSDSMLSNIVSLLEEALSKKPKIEKLANQISGYFSVTILVIAILTFAGWLYFNGSFERALIVAISVIVIACPCALGLATPMATLVGIATASKKGILFKEAGFLESLAKCDTVVFDKTGTLTKAKPKVVKSVQIKEFDKSLLYSLLMSSNHPISKGVAEFFGTKEDLKEYKLDDIKQIEAKGLSATYKGVELLGGSEKLFLKEQLKDMKVKSNQSIFIFSIDKQIVAIYYLEDQIKEGAKEVIEKLKQDGLDIVMLTGDNESVAKKVAKTLGIKKFKASMFPTDKAKYIDDLHKKSHRVVMVGDGINDALVLAKSDIAIAMGSGADISIEVSDVVLLNDDMNSLYNAYKIAKKTYTNIKENLILSLLYNLITIPIAVMGYVIPLVAALSMSLSSLLVVFNAFRIKRSLK